MRLTEKLDRMIKSQMIDSPTIVCGCVDVGRGECIIILLLLLLLYLC